MPALRPAIRRRADLPGITPSLMLVAISDPRAGAQAVADGTADLYYSLSPDWPTAPTGVKVAQGPADQLATIDLRAAQGPLADAAVRTAIGSALVARTQAYSGDLVEMADAYAAGTFYQAAAPAVGKAAFDAKMRAAMNGVDPKARGSLSTALLGQLVAERSVLPLFSYADSWVLSDSVSGLKTAAFNQVQLAGVTVR